MRLPRRSFLVSALTAAVLVTPLGAPGPADDGKPPVSVVPIPRTDGSQGRQTEVLRRVTAATAPIPVVFLGDSITQAWEGEGKDIWAESIAPLGAVNLGVGGDRTEHVLWRLNQAPLTPLAPKAVVVMIGTNNLGHGSSNAEQTLLGVRRVVETLRTQVPDATIILFSIFPRGARFNPMRGDICQINQALLHLAGDHVIVKDVGHRFVDDKGTIPPTLMPDELHLSKAAYGLWRDEVLPLLTTALAK